MLRSSLEARAVAELVRASAMRLESIVDTLTIEAWTGADADRFRTEWRTRVTSELAIAADHLDELRFDALDSERSGVG